MRWRWTVVHGVRFYSGAVWRPHPQLSAPPNRGCDIPVAPKCVDASTCSGRPSRFLHKRRDAASPLGDASQRGSDVHVACKRRRRASCPIPLSTYFLHLLSSLAAVHLHLISHFFFPTHLLISSLKPYLTLFNGVSNFEQNIKISEFPLDFDVDVVINLPVLEGVAFRGCGWWCRRAGISPFKTGNVQVLL